MLTLKFINTNDNYIMIVLNKNLDHIPELWSRHLTYEASAIFGSSTITIKELIRFGTTNQYVIHRYIRPSDF